MESNKNKGIKKFFYIIWRNIAKNVMAPDIPEQDAGGKNYEVSKESIVPMVDFR